MKLHSPDLKEVKIRDPFWSPRVDLVRGAILPYQWEAMNDRIPDAQSSHCLENFKIAAGRGAGAFYGAPFQDTDVYKWLEAVGYTLAAHPDAELEKTADGAIELIAAAQCEDGYLNTYFTLTAPEKRWQNLCEGHELYTAGHLMEAAVAYYQGTGKRALLQVAARFADLICRTFGPGEGQIHGYPGHQEVEIGLIRLHAVTGEQAYLDTARYFIDARGVGENYFLREMARPGFAHIFPEFLGYEPRYSQSHLPVRQQATAEGHAVRAVYMYCAMADLADAYQDGALLDSCRRLWKNMVERRMYITGGIGSSGILERFTTDYDLPNEYGYCESCASIGLMLFGLRMAAITREASYFDTVERALYNTVLAGIALDGQSFFYVNPLEVWPASCLPRTSKEHVKPVRQKWFGVACCPPNIARTLASLGQYIYLCDGEGVFVNLFVSNETRLQMAGGKVLLKLSTRFPAENTFTLAVSGVPAGGITLRLRIPGYAAGYRVEREGRPLAYETDKGYAVLRLEGDAALSVSFSAPARFVRGNPRIRSDAGKAALVRGPLVYCLEEADNGENLSALFADTNAPIQEQYEPELLGGVVALRAAGRRLTQAGFETGAAYSSAAPVYEAVTLRAVPYACWGNRQKGEMAVWIKALT